MSHSYNDICPKCHEECHDRRTHTCPLQEKDAVLLLEQRWQEFLDDREDKMYTSAERNLKKAFEAWQESKEYARTNPAIKTKTYSGPDRRAKPRVRPKR